MQKGERDGIIPIGDYLEKSERPQYGHSEEIHDRGLTEARNREEESRMMPDTFGADCMFLEYFVTPEMSDDFPMIARDFLLHEANIISNDRKVDYLDKISEDVTTAQSMENWALNLMMNSFRNGSEYTKNLFRYLYKTYYRKEYRQLKRYSTLSRGELIDLSTSEFEHVSPTLLAVNLTMAQVFDIEIQPECNDIFYLLNRYYEQRQEIRLPNWTFMDDVVEENEESEEEIKSLFKDSDEMLHLEAEYGKFLNNALRSRGFPGDYAAYCNSDDWGIEDRLVRTLSILKKTFPKRKYTKEELLVYASIYEVVSALTCSADEMENWLYELTTGERGENSLAAFPPEFDPNEVSQKGSSKAKPKEDRSKNEKVVSEPKYREADLLQEIEDLHRRIHEQEGVIKRLRGGMAGHQKLLAEKADLMDQMDAEREELEALRRHVYQLTEEDEPISTVSISEMQEALKKLRIVIVGGHSNWKQKLRNLFDKWIFIDPKTTGSVDPDVVAKADYVYFFTDTISHGTYYRFINAVRENGVKFGYLHGVNVEKTIRAMYRDQVE